MGNRDRRWLAGSALPFALRGLLGIGALLMVNDAALALDPQRTLTQALLRKWQIPQGLPQPAIHATLQTADRVFWLGTQAGLFQFDGVRFAAVKVTRGIPLDNLWIHDLCEDAEHNVWIATHGAGLIRYRDGHAEQFVRPDLLPSPNVNCLKVDRDQTLWIGTDAGLCCYRQERFQSFPQADGPGAAAIRALCSAADGTLWIGGEDQPLMHWNGKQFTRHNGSTPSILLALNSTSAIWCDPRGILFVGTSAGLVRIEGKSEQLFTRAEGLADDAVQCLFPARDDGLWIGTKDGVSRLQVHSGDDVERQPGNRFENFRMRDGLTQRTVFTICEDHEGSLWVGTKNGLNQFIERRIVTLTANEGLPGNDTGPIQQTGDGQIWIGTRGQGLARSEGRRVSLAFTTETGLPSNTILSLVAGNDADLWIGTDQGLCRMHAGRIAESWTTSDGLPSKEIHCLHRDPRGTIWVGTSAGLVQYAAGRFQQPGKQSSPQPSNSLAASNSSPLWNSAIVAITDHDQDGLLIAVENHGVYRLAGDRVESLSNGGTPLENATCFHRVSPHSPELWIGTRGDGLILRNGERQTSFKVQDGLYDDEIFGIGSDDDGRLWMACSRGIFSVSRAELQKFTAGELKRLNCAPFSPTESQRTIECQRDASPALCRAADQRLWFSTSHGVILIDPRTFYRPLLLPPVTVEEVQANGEATNPARPLTLPPGVGNLYFRYTVRSYAFPVRIQFRHRLEGFDKDWVEAGFRREAFYTNLPPGTYRFQVIASNPNSNSPWTESANGVEFTILPHFYKTWWFLWLMILSAVLAVWLVFRIRMLQLRARMNAVVAERSRIARELHDTLIQGFSGVTMQLQALATRLRSLPESRSLEEIIADAGLCLREARRSVAGLRQQGSTGLSFAAAIAETARQMTETRDIRLILNVPTTFPTLPADTEYDLLRIAQEAIANGVKHASATTIEVALRMTPEGVGLMIRDDGCGFLPRIQEMLSHGHYGLIGMRERALNLRATLDVQSQPGEGTMVSLWLPLPHQTEAGTSQESPDSLAAAREFRP